MKKSFIVLLLAGVFASCGARPEAIIKGTVTGSWDEGAQIILMNSQRQFIDTVDVVDGKFRLEVAKAYPDLAAIAFSSQVFPFILEPGTIDVEFDFTNRPGTAVFSGTPTNDGMAALNKAAASFDGKLNELSDKLSAMQTEGKGAAGEFREMAEQYYAILEERSQNFIDGALENPATVLASYIVSDSSRAQTVEAIDSLLNLMVGAPANAFLDRMRERREGLAKTAVGAVAPDFTQNTPEGTPFTLSSLRGKLVLIDFWASWCGPCRGENPNVVKVYDKYKVRGFEIVGVSLDEDRYAWLEAIEQDGLGWIQVSDVQGWQNEVAKMYAVTSIPHTVLVDAEGVIIAKNLRGEALEARIAEVLGGADAK